MANSLIYIVLILALLAVVLWLWIKLDKSKKRANTLQESLLRMRSTSDNLHLETIETVLNPHLFKNILNSVQSHAYQTYFSLDKLANILDYILYESKKRYVTPKEEIAFAKDLIEVNRIKLSPLFELTVKTRVDETAPLYEQNILAPLISIDLIENAFKHADLQSADAYISIVFEYENDVFSLTVANKVSPKSQFRKEKSGIGSITFEQRLDFLYKGCYELERITEDGAFIARLKINLNEYKAKMFTP